MLSKKYPQEDLWISGEVFAGRSSKSAAIFMHGIRQRNQSKKLRMKKSSAHINCGAVGNPFGSAPGVDCVVNPLKEGIQLFHTLEGKLRMKSVQHQE